MKASLILALFSLVAVNAHAALSADKAAKSVRCTGDNGQTIVEVNAARTQIKITGAMDPGHPDLYTIDDTQSDGDTFKSYRGVVVSPDPDTYATVSFDDQGDTLTYQPFGEDAQAPIALKGCK